MGNSAFVNAKKWRNIFASPIAMSIILLLWHLAFKDEERHLYSLSVIGFINLIFFYLSLYVLCPKAISSGSTKRLVITTVIFSTLYTIVHIAVFGSKIVQLPFPFTIEDYPLSFYVSILYVIALTLFLAGLSLHLVINHLSISYESFNLLQKSYENEIDALKLQMNPHFIANALNNISGMIRDNNINGSIAYTSELISLTGKQLNATSSMSVPLKDELQWIETYLKMEQSRLEQSFDFSITMDKSIKSDATIPPMLLQPILENSIFHGFNPEKFTKKGRIEVSITKKKSKNIVIVIKDNGLGSEAKRNQAARNRDSVSTDNIANRIKLINELGNFYIKKSTKMDANGATVEITVSPPML